jgi:hypothetical protein
VGDFDEGDLYEGITLPRSERLDRRKSEERQLDAIYKKFNDSELPPNMRGL